MPCSAWRVQLFSGTVVTLTEQAYAPYQPALGALPLPVAEDCAPRIATGEVRLFESAGQAAGLLVIETHRDHCLIFSVVVSPGQRGKGFGIRPLENAEQLAREVGFGLHECPDSSHRALCQAFGYSETGRQPNPKRPGWILVDLVKDPSG